MDDNGLTTQQKQLKIEGKSHRDAANRAVALAGRVVLLSSHFKIEGYSSSFKSFFQEITKSKLSINSELLRYFEDDLRDLLQLAAESGSFIKDVVNFKNEDTHFRFLCEVSVLKSSENSIQFLVDFIDNGNAPNLNDKVEEKQQFIERVFDTVNSGIKITDFDGNILATNVSYAKMLGYFPEELYGLNILTYVHPDDKEAAISQLSDFALNGISPQKHWRLLCKKGNTIHTNIIFSKARMEGQDVVIYSVMDIGSHINTKADLEEVSAENNVLIDNLSIMLWSVDKDLNFITANAAAKRYFKDIYGYTFTKGDYALNIYGDRLKEVRKSRRQAYLQVISNKKKHPFTILDESRDRLYHFTGEMYPTLHNGEVVGVNCFMQLDTEHFLKDRFIHALKNFKIAAANASDQEELYWLLTEKILAHLYLDESAVLIVGETYLHAATYYAKNKTLSRKLENPFSIPKSKGVVGAVVQNAAPEVIADSSKDDRTLVLNQPFASEIAVPVIADGNVVAVINCESQHKGFFDDPIYLEILTDAAKELGTQISKLVAEKRLKEVEEINKAVLDSTPDSFLLLDRNATILSFNRRAYKRLTHFYGRELVVGASFHDYLPQRYHQNFTSHLHKAFSGFLGKEDYELEFAGKPLWMRATYSAAYNGTGELFGVNLVLKDITVDRENENLLRKKNEELEKSNSELDKFVYSVSHDLRAPLSSILGLSHLIEVTEDPKEIKEFNQMIMDSGLKLDEFIRSILSYSRNTHLAVGYSSFNFKDLITEIISGLTYMGNTSKLTLEKIIDRPKIHHDQERIKIILSSLLSNSFKYADLKKEKPYVRINIFTEDGFLYLSVADNGQGIEQKHIPNLFDMFFTANLRAKGSGIGLYILKDAVNALKGEVEVQSELGIGTKFIIKLPLISS